MFYFPYILSGILLLAFLTFALSYFLYFYYKKKPLTPSYAYSLNEEDFSKTSLDFLLDDFSDKHQGLGREKDALGLIIRNLDAFAGRATATALAGRSLDLMYYIWEDDLTGRLLLYEVLKAADRGARVRLLIDDINSHGRDPIYAALDRHENIEVRVFNPRVIRNGFLQRMIEMLFRAFSLTRRMHNKAYIVDGRLAFVGGRNIGDCYFDASKDSNFRDLDLLLIGHSVKKVEDVFDRYWNSEIVQPIRSFVAQIKKRELEKWRTKLEKFRSQEAVKKYIHYIHCYMPVQHLFRVNRLLFPVEKVEIFSDPPEKALQGCLNEWMVIKIFDKLKKAKKKLHITSPYFIPGKIGVNFLGRLAKKGVDVQILTNSLAATDVAIVHSGYAAYRKALLKRGIKIFELKSDCWVPARFHLLGLKKASLHSKAFLIDQKAGFVGSFNFDSRSVSLNTEMGLFFECSPLVEHMNLVFGEETTGEMSYKLQLDDRDKLVWSWLQNGVSYQSKREPSCSLLLRLFVKFSGWLPIESQL